MALDEEVWRSNLGRGSEIERLRVKGARAAALAAPAACSRGGAARKLAGVGNLGATEGHSGFCLVQKDVYATRNPLEGT